MRKLLVAVFLLTALAVALPALAQDAGYEVADPGDGDALQSGGGDNGTQFPEGTSDCSGDRHHHAHGSPTQACVLRNNPHYATTMGGGTHCTNRAKHCDSCYNCCSKQRTEAELCHCMDDACRNMQEEVERTCKHDCFGNMYDTCSAMP